MAAWLGLSIGLLELVLLSVKRWGLQVPIYMTPQVVWAAPLTYVLVFVPLSVALVWGGRFWRPVGQVRTVVFLLGLLGAYSGIQVFHLQLHDVAEWLVALGVAARLAGSASAHAEKWLRLARRSVAWLALVVVILGAGVNVAPLVAERRALATLPAARDGAPNVLFIIWDTARAASMSLYSHDQPTTPELERLAARAVVFDRAVATSSWSNPSHGSIVTGHFPYNVGADWGHDLDARHPTLAEVFRDAGYRTAAFSANSRYFSRQTGFHRGFLRFDDYPRLSLTGNFTTTWLGKAFTHRDSWLPRKLGVVDSPGRKKAPDVLQPLLRWIGDGNGPPFFATINLMDAHDPYLPPQPFASRFNVPARPTLTARIGRRIRRTLGNAPAPSGAPVPRLERDERAYQASIAYLDHELAGVFAELETRGLLNRTAIILTADHGEEFGEHGPIRHGWSLYWLSLHVPLVIWAPGESGPGGIRVTEPVSLRALPATTAELAGITSHPFPGISLAAAFGGYEVGDTVLSELSWREEMPTTGRAPVLRGNMRSLVRDSLHYVLNGDDTEELYDIVRDPAETENLIGRVPQESLEPLRRLLRAIPTPDRKGRLAF